MDVATSIGMKKKGEGTDGIELEAITATSPVISALRAPLAITSGQSITNNWLTNCCRGKCFTRRSRRQGGAEEQQQQEQSGSGSAVPGTAPKTEREEK